MGYQKKLSEQFARYEGRCKRCGACCGAFDDPCLNLAKGDDGKYFCRDYENRIGQQHTVSGKQFTCVPIRDNFKYNSPRPGCGYANKPT